MWTFRNCFQRSVDLEAKLSCCNFSKKWVNKFVFLSWWHRNTWNLNFNFKLQVFPSRQDRKTNSSICFWGEVTTRQFCFEIYWPLPVTTLFFSFLPICISNWFSIYFFAEFMLNGALLDFLRKEDGKGKVTFDNLISISGQVWNFFQIFLYMISLIILSNQVDSYSFHRGYVQNNSNQMKQKLQ